MRKAAFMAAAPVLSVSAASAQNAPQEGSARRPFRQFRCAWKQSAPNMIDDGALNAANLYL